ncbi:Hypothetical secreted protein [Ligilactobacillus ruminis ATCC 27782]|uniref:Hypothetical secreted protein n=1 Tax=Ligilactobacillus ruminis (strain ATCC 27782 / RF3) TaxID=1069534 RepID=G2SRL4_LIGR2|nr:Hypothetical secreted protein [Ligilactobacillus ruminis ATCC 27782]
MILCLAQTLLALKKLQRRWKRKGFINKERVFCKKKFLNRRRGWVKSPFSRFN